MAHRRQLRLLSRLLSVLRQSGGATIDVEMKVGTRMNASISRQVLTTDPTVSKRLVFRLQADARRTSALVTEWSQ